MTTSTPTDKPTYEQFKEEWLSSIERTDLSPFDKGVEFATKLITEWLDVTVDDEDFYICDGSGDGGIDIAYLKRSDLDGKESESEVEGDTWFVVQSKYGAAFSGSRTIRDEASKVLATLSGQTSNLSTVSRQIVEKIATFKQQALPPDRIVLTFATLDPIPEQDRQAFDDVKIIGRQRIGELFDVQEVSLMRIWEPQDNGSQPGLSVPIKGQFIDHNSKLLVGTVSLTDLFDFLQSFRRKAGHIDQLYEKNVRQFLGGQNKINKGIAETLSNSPEEFGLYNNGITIVTSGFNKSSKGTVTLSDPYIVNGCQTTKTIWQVLDRWLNAGGSGEDSAIEKWKDRVKQGGVVTKIVHSSKANVMNITRFTNSQSAVREKDFVTLETGFAAWAREMEREHKIFLEIQRGGIAARKSYEKQRRQSTFEDYVNAFDLIKVYGAGWLGVPGIAFGKNAPFLPKGSVFDRIMEQQEGVRQFDVEDLYAAYQVKCEADKVGFGRGSNQGSRRLSRFLFYFVLIRLTTHVIRRTQPSNGGDVSPRTITDAILKLSAPEAYVYLKSLSRAAVELVDEYLTPGGDHSIQTEPAFYPRYNGNMNTFLKSDDLGKDAFSPQLLYLLHIHEAVFDRSPDKESVADVIRQPRPPNPPPPDAQVAATRQEPTPPPDSPPESSTDPSASR